MTVNRITLTFLKGSSEKQEIEYGCVREGEREQERERLQTSTFTEKNVETPLTKDFIHIRFEALGHSLCSILTFCVRLSACRHQTPTTKQCTFTVRVIWSSHQWLIKIT